MSEENWIMIHYVYFSENGIKLITSRNERLAERLE